MERRASTKSSPKLRYRPEHQTREPASRTRASRVMTPSWRVTGGRTRGSLNLHRASLLLAAPIRGRGAHGVAREALGSTGRIPARPRPSSLRAALKTTSTPIIGGIRASTLHRGTRHGSPSATMASSVACPPDPCFETRRSAEQSAEPRARRRFCFLKPTFLSAFCMKAS